MRACLCGVCGVWVCLCVCLRVGVGVGVGVSVCVCDVPPCGGSGRAEGGRGTRLMIECAADRVDHLFSTCGLQIAAVALAVRGAGMPRLAR